MPCKSLRQTANHLRRGTLFLFNGGYIADDIFAGDQIEIFARDETSPWFEAFDVRGNVGWLRAEANTAQGNSHHHKHQQLLPGRKRTLWKAPQTNVYIFPQVAVRHVRQAWPIETSRDSTATKCEASKWRPWKAFIQWMLCKR